MQEKIYQFEILKHKIDLSYRSKYLPDTYVSSLVNKLL
jgi:hypothetical protein